MKGQMAIAIALSGFNDLGLSGAPIFLDGALPLLIFYFLRKIEEIYRLEGYFFLQIKCTIEVRSI